MRKFTRIQKRLLTIIVVLCILACAMFGLRQNSITNIGYSAWTYLKYGLIQYPLSSIGNAVNDFSNLWHAYDDNEYLTKQLAQQKNYQTAYEDERNKNKQLEALLEMKGGLGDAKTISVSVLERSGDSWLQTVTISAGKKQGVEKNMLVATSDGTISMARSSANNSASSQFFIMQKDTPSLDGQYAAFGTVTSGMDIVDKICKDCTDTNQNGVITDKSKQPVISTIRVVD